MKYFISKDNRILEVEVSDISDGDHIQVTQDSETYDVKLRNAKSNLAEAVIGDKVIEFGWERKDNKYTVIIDGANYEVRFVDKIEQIAISKKEVKGERAEVKAPIPGLITAIKVKVGEKVLENQPLLSLSAMKLENEILSPANGKIKAIMVKVGDKVEKDQKLVEIE